MRLPDPIVAAFITPHSRADEERMHSGLARLAEQDQALRIKSNVETGQLFIYGMSEAHLDIIADRLKRDFNVNADISAPQAAYKETIRKVVNEEAKFIRKTGGHGQYGHVILKIEPLALGMGFEFAVSPSQGFIPHTYIPAVEKGVREGLEVGALAGYPLVDLKVTLVGGSADAADSNEMAFKIAAAMALRAGCKKASPTILEPIVRCEISAPEQYMGDIISDLKSRRAKINDAGDAGTSKYVRCTAPMSEMFGYASFCRSITMGRAAFTLEPSHYEEVPLHILKASIDPHSPDEPPAASAGRPVRPIRPKPGIPGGQGKSFPPEK